MSNSEILLNYDIPSLTNPLCCYARQVQFRIASALKLSLTKLEYFVWLWSNAATHHEGRQLDYFCCTSCAVISVSFAEKQWTKLMSLTLGVLYPHCVSESGSLT